MDIFLFFSRGLNQMKERCSGVIVPHELEWIKRV